MLTTARECLSIIDLLLKGRGIQLKWQLLLLLLVVNHNFYCQRHKQQ